jgi:hypothetical protein
MLGAPNLPGRFKIYMYIHSHTHTHTHTHTHILPFVLLLDVLIEDPLIFPYFYIQD